MKTKHLLSLSLLLLSASAVAQTIDESTAMQKATSFFSKSSRAKVAAQNATPQVSLAYTASSGDETYFYVFNSNSSDGGFVIVGGDETAQEILGYSNTSTFDYDSAPDNMKWWLSQYSQQIHEAIADVNSGKVIVEDKTENAKARGMRKAAGRTSIPELIKTKWGQNEPFNESIKKISDAYAPFVTGCVATAMAQVMKYHEYPTQGTGNYGYTRYYDATEVEFKANFGSTTYDWGHMINEYKQNEYNEKQYTNSEADAVSKLMYHCGVSVQMNYGQDASSASTSVVPSALSDYFGYSKSGYCADRKYYTNEEWEDLIYNELKNGRPVIYGGQDEHSNNGHAFVCHGYDDSNNTYAINWGWNGSCDGYFSLSASGALMPHGNGTGGAGDNAQYTRSQDALINIMPDPYGTSVYTKIMTLSGDFGLAANEAQPGQSVNISGWIFNSSRVTTDFTYGMKFVNVSKPSDEFIINTNTTHTLESGQAQSLSFTIPYDATVGATYTVIPLFIDENGEWKEARKLVEQELPTLTITNPTGIALSKEFAISNNGYVSENNFHITFSVKNYESTPQEANFIVWVFPAEGGYSLGYALRFGESFKAEEEKSYDITATDFDDIFTSGTSVSVRLDNYEVGQLTNTIPLHYCEEITIPYILTEAKWGTICLPFDAEIPEGLSAYTITGVDGYSLVKLEADKFEMNKPYLVTGTPNPNPYKFTGPNTPPVTGSKNGMLVGNTAPSDEGNYVYAPAGSYVLQNNSQGLGFYEVALDNTQKIRQYSAYLKYDKSAFIKQFNIVSEDTAIDGIAESASGSDAPAYNLNGIRVNRNAKGFVIINGKLIYNK